jgi:hypothetical protein
MLASQFFIKRRYCIKYSIALRQLGFSTGLMAKIGDDLFGQGLMMKILEDFSSGLQLIVDSASSTSYSYVIALQVWIGSSCIIQVPMIPSARQDLDYGALPDPDCSILVIPSNEVACMRTRY